jgi:hypothetical protein
LDLREVWVWQELVLYPVVELVKLEELEVLEGQMDLRGM